MNPTKKNLLTITILLCHGLAIGQELKLDLQPFDKVIASPRIHLILEQGERESIRLVYNNVSAEKINVDVARNTLRIYLDKAKVTDKMERIDHNEKRSIYADVSVTAYVTYKALNHLEIRGNQELSCTGPLQAEKFTLKAYGENEIRLASLQTEYLKTSLYGQNDLKIKAGKADYQKYKLYGENKIDTRELKSYVATTNIYGESRVKLYTQDDLKINAFGESEVSYDGDAE